MSATKAPKKPKSADKKGVGSSKAKAAKAGKSSAKSGAAKRQNKDGHKRLRPGELDGLVLSYMHRHEDELPLSPTRIAKAIKRSSGAVGNCLERLAKAKPPKARLAKKAPREYDLKGVKAR
jgi:hypothetical protein